MPTPLKTVQITLPPGDVGPICSYPPYCSDQDLSVWRLATISLTECPIVPENGDRELIQTWILQIVRRELTVHLQQAERELRRPLEITVDEETAEVISRALHLRIAAQELKVSDVKKGKGLEQRLADLEKKIADLAKR
jgi:hypothetical protein